MASYLGDGYSALATRASAPKDLMAFGSVLQQHTQHNIGELISKLLKCRRLLCAGIQYFKEPFHWVTNKSVNHSTSQATWTLDNDCCSQVKHISVIYWCVVCHWLRFIPLEGVLSFVTRRRWMFVPTRLVKCSNLSLPSQVMITLTLTSKLKRLLNHWVWRWWLVRATLTIDKYKCVTDTEKN